MKGLNGHNGFCILDVSVTAQLNVDEFALIQFYISTLMNIYITL